LRSPTEADIAAARPAVATVAKRTPVLSTRTLSERVGGTVALKAENLQRTGSFKVRGAAAKLAALGDACAAGVVAASAGNHAQGLAAAAAARGVPCEVFVPADAPLAKVAAAREQGAKVTVGGPSIEECIELARDRAEAGGIAFVHPYDDRDVVAGQGSLGLELLEEVPDLARVVVPVGGGGLCSGVAIAVKSARPEVEVIGVQIEGCAPYLESLRRGEIVPMTSAALTIADGIAVKRPGELTLRLLSEWVDGMAVVGEEETAEAMVLLLERAKLVVEGAGAAALAAVLANRVGGRGQVAALLSGGNIDPTLLISVMRHGLTSSGRYLVVRTKISDRPGELLKLLSLVAEERVNVISVEHHREGLDLPVVETEVELTLGTRDREHRDALLAAMRAWGYGVERVR
jgi:threonine dehydratase